MQPLFGTSGWSLPTSIVLEKEEKSAKTNKPRGRNQEPKELSKEEAATKEADQLQKQVWRLRLQTGQNDPKPYEPTASKRPLDENGKPKKKAKPSRSKRAKLAAERRNGNAEPRETQESAPVKNTTIAKPEPIEQKPKQNNIPKANKATKETPVKAAIDTPVEVAKVSKETVKKAPAKETPAKETPAKETPAKETPAKKAPAKETPVKTAQVPKETENEAVKDTPAMTNIKKEQPKVEATGKALNNLQKKKLQALLANKTKASVENVEKPKSEKIVEKPKKVEKVKKAPIAKSMAPAQKAGVVTPAAKDTKSTLTALQIKMKEKLSGARFRWLNEQLYTTKGDEAYELFQEKPELFDEYHEGFRHQVESWPVNPVDVITDQLREMPAGTVVADLGCGDAKIGHVLTEQKVLSFDLIAKNDKVIACDISKLPLPANFVDVVVFSLSLMGTNYLDFLKEAYRVLKVGGELKIAEVVSRFSDVDSFIDLLENLGFEFIGKEDDNKMFVMMYFNKRSVKPTGEDADDDEMLEGLSKTQKRSLQKGAGVRGMTATKMQKQSQQLLKPCLYKKR
ncbi:methyltransferase-domain-containing protein [Phycomyces nitens]|nr:methyltransferase-domain-containing protein [Phycomyces nitens]